jgi:hypothetical protein
MLIAEPERCLGKVVYEKLVFPKHGKPGGAILPGPQQVDRSLWAQLCEKAREFHRAEREAAANRLL